MNAKRYPLRYMIIICCMLFNVSGIRAQILNQYSFSQTSSGTYDTLVTAQTLGTGAALNNEVYAVSLPFSFNFNNTVYNNIYVGVNGYISFGNTNPGAGFWMLQSSLAGVVSAFDANLAGKDANTKLSYQTTGSAPNRTFIIEWKNFGYNSSTALTTNFQMRLAETNGIISCTYDDVSLIGSSNISIQVGLAANGFEYNNRRSTTSDWLNTTAGIAASSNIAYTAFQNPPRGLRYTYTPPACPLPGQPTNLTLTATTSAITVGYTAPTTAPSGYMIVRTDGTTSLNDMPRDGTTYTTGNTIGNGTIVYMGSSRSFSNSGLPQTTQYTYTVFPYNSSCYNAPRYNTTTPLTGNRSTLGPRTYYWTSTAATADFQVASNWTPARTFTDIADTLIFSNGVTAAISNLPATLTVNRLLFSGNSTITFNNSIPAAIFVNRSFVIDAGSAYTLDGGNAITMGFNAPAIATINGDLTLSGSCAYDARYANTVVNGSVSVQGANSDFNTSCTTNCTNEFRFGPGAKYIHQRNGGKIPSAAFDATATVYLTGVTSVSPAMSFLSNQNRMMGNLVVNSPAATTVISTTSVWYNYNNVTVLNTGTGSFSFYSGARLAGNLDIRKGTVSASTITIQGNVKVDTGLFNHSQEAYIGGDVNVAATGTLTGGFHLNGNIHQQVVADGTISINGFNTKIKLNNPAGATLTGVIRIIYGTAFVTNGKWDGTGRFSYANDLSAILAYDGPTTLYTSAVEWPVHLDKPRVVNIMPTGPAPYNRVYLQEDHVDTGSLYLDMKSGILALGNHDLTCVFANVNTLGAYMPFVATNGTGSLYQTFGTGNTSFNYPLGDFNNGDKYTPVVLRLNNNTVSRQIGARVVNGTHPSMPAATDYITRYWSLKDDQTAPVSYTARFGFSAADKRGADRYPLQLWNDTSWTAFLTTVAIDTNISRDSITGNLNQKTFAAFNPTSLTSNTYTWNGSISNDFQVAGNWTPARNNISFSDILLFNTGGTLQVNNTPPQTITRLQVSNNTNLNLSGTVLTNPNFTNSFNFISDNDAATNELEVAAGSTLSFPNVGRLLLGFLGNGSKALVAGTLDMNVYGQINFTNCKGYVTPAGILSAGAPTVSGVYQNPFVSGDSTLTIDGTYLNNFIATAGYMPYATWGNGSNAIINNKTVLIAPTGIKQSFFNLTYNANIAQNWSSQIPDSVRGTFRIAATGSTGTFGLGSVGAVMYIGKLSMISGTVSLLGNFYITDSVVKTGGRISCASTSTGIYFSGTSGRQYFASNDSAFFGNGNYIITNPSGIIVAAVSPFTGNQNFFISKGMTVTTKAMPPVTTALGVVYSAATTLTYEGPARQSEAALFPATGAPTNLTVNLDSVEAVLSMPFTRGIQGTLRLQNGDLDLGSQSFTIGTSVSTPGDFNGTGKIRFTTGSLTRWLSTISDETAVGNLRAYYPIAYGGSDRTVSLFFNNTSAITTGGTLTVQHTNAANMTTGLNLVDASFVINNRFNSNWSFTPGNGLAVGGTIGMALMTGDNYINTTSLRIMWPQTVVGNNYTTSLGSFPVARNNLSLSNLADSAFYIGSNTSNTSNIFTSVTTGNWANPTTWDRNAVPSANDYVYIDEADTVSILSNATARTITVKPYGTLKVTGGNSTVDLSITNNGTFRMENGSLTLGQTNVCNRLFTNPAGSFYSTGGRLFINGGFTCYGPGFTQTGGDIIVDPNGTSASLNGTPVWLYTTNVNATGGTLMIVDPSASGGSTFIGGGFSPGHKLVLGDSVSTAAQTTGFILQTNNRVLGTVIVNGTASVSTGRDVKLYGNTRIAGDLLLRNTNARFAMTQYYLYLKGNLTLDANTTFIADYPIYLSEVDGTANNIAQSISGSGKIYNATSMVPNLNFMGLILNNTAGISFDIGNFTVSNQITLMNGRIDLNGSTITQNGTLNYSFGQQDANCWINGKYRTAVTTLQDGKTYIFPVGNALASKTVTLSIPDWNTVTTGGYITVSNQAGDHSNIASSAINPNKTINQQYIIDTSNSAGLVLGSGVFNISLRHSLADLDANLNPANLTIGKYANAGWTYYPPASVSPLSTSATIPGNELAGAYQLGESDTNPYFTQQPQNQQVCTGNDALLQVVAQNANQYQWQVKISGSWSPVQNGPVYNGAGASVLRIMQPPLSMNGYVYRCIAYRFDDSVISNEATLSVGSGITPVITIAVTPGTTLCAGQPATFTATAVNGGTLPQYQWKVNGVPAGNGLATFTTNTLPNNALVTCELTSSLTCASPANVSSMPIAITVLPATPLSVAITSSAPGNTLCAGSSITFNATVINGGTTPTYQWKKNGANTGNNSNVYTDNNLTNNDVISCTVTGSECTAASTVASNNITMTVNPMVTPQITISTTNSSVCANQATTFTATITNGGTLPIYQWKVNGANAGTNAATFNAGILNNNDVISCVLTSNAGCTTLATTSSNNITMVVTPLVTPAISISTSTTTLCAGTNITFTATATNGGTAPAYQWKVNGVNTGTNSNTFATATLNNNDVVTCVLTSNAGCLSVATAASNNITMTVNPVLTPQITIAANTTTICAGGTVNFTATITNGGTTPVYEWKINGATVGTNSATFISTTLNNSDVVTCVLTSSIATCMTASQATSNGIGITVNPMVTPAISIISATGNTFCQGSNAIFTATATNGGPVPVYQWLVNNVAVGANSATYSTTALNNNDIVSCRLTSNATCILTNTATSNSITATVNPAITPTVSITATPGTTVPVGTTIVFTANVTNGGTSPAFQWKKNGVNIGTNAATYSSNSFNDGDNITVTVTSNAICATPATVTSNTLTVHYSTGIPEAGNDSYSFQIYPNPAKDKVVISADFKYPLTGESITVEMVDMVGKRIISSGQLRITGNKLVHELPLPASIADGTYLIKLNCNGAHFIKKIVVSR